MRAIARPTTTAIVRYLRPRSATQNARGAIRRSSIALCISSNGWPMQPVPKAFAGGAEVKWRTLPFHPALPPLPLLPSLAAMATRCSICKTQLQIFSLHLSHFELPILGLASCRRSDCRSLASLSRRNACLFRHHFFCSPPFHPALPPSLTCILPSLPSRQQHAKDPGPTTTAQHQTAARKQPAMIFTEDRPFRSSRRCSAWPRPASQHKCAAPFCWRRPAHACRS